MYRVLVRISQHRSRAIWIRAFQFRISLWNAHRHQQPAVENSTQSCATPPPPPTSYSLSSFWLPFSAHRFQLISSHSIQIPAAVLQLLFFFFSHLGISMVVVYMFPEVFLCTWTAFSASSLSCYQKKYWGLSHEVNKVDQLGNSLTL